jgi:hypothetical protein
MKGKRYRANLTVEFELDPVWGWGDNPNDHVQLMIRNLQKGSSYNLEVLKATSQLAREQWKLEDDWQLVVEVLLKEAVESREEHPLQIPSWKKEDN